MALDPSIILQQRRMPSYWQERQVMEQIQALQQEREIRALGLQEKRRLAQEYAGLAELARQAATPQPRPQASAAPVSQAAMVPPALPGESYGADVLMQRQPIPGGDIQRIAASQPGMQYSRMDATQQVPGLQRQATQESASTATYDDGMPKLRWQDVMRVAPTVGPQWMANYEKYTQGDLKERLAILKDGMDMYGDTLNAVVDQPSLDAGRAFLKKYVKDLAPLLPEKYDKDDIERRRQQFVPLKTRIDQMKKSLNITYGVDAQGNVVPMQATQAGGLERAAVPEGVSVLGPLDRVNLGTSQQVMSRVTGQPVGNYPIDVRGKAEQESGGKYAGEFAEKEPERRKAAQESLASLGKKQQIAAQDIDKALNILNTSNLPVTGVGSDFLSAFYQPGKDLRSLLGTIRSQVGLEEYQQLRATGGSLGQVTEGEHRLLQQVLGNLETAQSKAQLVTQLGRLKQTLNEYGARREQAFQRDFGSSRSSGVDGGGTSPHAGKSPASMKAHEVEEERAWLQQQLQRQYGRPGSSPASSSRPAASSRTPRPAQRKRPEDMTQEEIDAELRWHDEQGRR